MAQDFWQTGRTGAVAKGDLLINVAVLAGPLQIVVDDNNRPVTLTYGTRLDLALIVAEPPGIFWLAPVLQARHFPDQAIFDRLLALARAAPGGCFALDPLPPDLRQPSLALLNMPSALPREAIEVTGFRRLASLSPLYLTLLTGAMHACL